MTSETKYVDQSTLSSEFGLSSLQAGTLNELLRKQLTPSSKESVGLKQETSDKPLDESKLTEEATVLMASADFIDCILTTPAASRDVIRDKLSLIFHLQKDIFDSLGLPDELRKRQYISRSGLILSPDNCLTSIMDDMRVSAFNKAAKNAITEKLYAKKRVSIAYPACGPFAPLLLPLLGWFKKHSNLEASALAISFIDIQEGAICSVRKLCEELDICDWVDGFYCMDALEFDEGKRFDVVLLESMQHGFTREGHLAIARHFAGKLTNNGELLPNEIVLNAFITSPQREYVEQWQNASEVSAAEMDPIVQKERITLGEIGAINARTLEQLSIISLQGGTELVEFNTLRLPDLSMQREPALIICTKVHVRNEIWLNEYDSGITHPLPDQHVCINFTPKENRVGDLLVKSGDAIKFYYRWIGLPGFLITLDTEGSD